MPTTSRNTPQAHPESHLIQYRETRGPVEPLSGHHQRTGHGCVPSPPFHGLGKRDASPSSQASRKWSMLPLSSLGCGQDSPNPSLILSFPKLQLEPPHAFGYNPGKTGSWGPGGRKSQSRDQGLACGQEHGPADGVNKDKKGPIFSVLGENRRGPILKDGGWWSGETRSPPEGIPSWPAALRQKTPGSAGCSPQRKRRSDRLRHCKRNSLA